MAAESTRRVLLATALAGAVGSLGLTGCKGITALGPVPSVGPDVVLLEHAIEAEEAMVATYRSASGSVAGTSTALGAARSVIAAIGAEHQAHLARLRARLILPPQDARKKPKPVSRRPEPLPDDLRGVLKALEAAERGAAARLTEQLAGAPPALAQLMASISASEAAHVVYLKEARSPR